MRYSKLEAAIVEGLKAQKILKEEFIKELFSSSIFETCKCRTCEPLAEIDKGLKLIGEDSFFFRVMMIKIQNKILKPSLIIYKYTKSDKSHYHASAITLEELLESAGESGKEAILFNLDLFRR